jgi:hypothetical protein
MTVVCSEKYGDPPPTATLSHANRAWQDVKQHEAPCSGDVSRNNVAVNMLCYCPSRLTQIRGGKGGHRKDVASVSTLLLTEILSDTIVSVY